jgi:cell division protein FtsL
MINLVNFKPNRLIRFSPAGLFAFILLLILALTGLAQVWMQHHLRHLETAYYEQLQLKSKLTEDWGRLMLEKSHLSSPSRVERNAREELDMQLPQTGYFVIIPIEPSPSSEPAQ